MTSTGYRSDFGPIRSLPLREFAEQRAREVAVEDAKAQAAAERWKKKQLKLKAKETVNAGPAPVDPAAVDAFVEEFKDVPPLPGEAPAADPVGRPNCCPDCGGDISRPYGGRKPESRNACHFSADGTLRRMTIPPEEVRRRRVHENLSASAPADPADHELAVDAGGTWSKCAKCGGDVGFPSVMRRGPCHYRREHVLDLLERAKAKRGKAHPELWIVWARSHAAPGFSNPLYAINAKSSYDAEAYVRDHHPADFRRGREYEIQPDDGVAEEKRLVVYIAEKPKPAIEKPTAALAAGAVDPAERLRVWRVYLRAKGHARTFLGELVAADIIRAKVDAEARWRAVDAKLLDVEPKLEPGTRKQVTTTAAEWDRELAEFRESFEATAESAAAAAESRPAEPAKGRKRKEVVPS